VAVHTPRKPFRVECCGQEFQFGCASLSVPHFHAACPSRSTLTESGEPDHKENDMTDTAKKPIDDSKEELTEAELDQVAGGMGAVGLAMDEKTSTLPAAPGKIREGFTSPSGSLPA
jgi:hypothetical protein